MDTTTTAAGGFRRAVTRFFFAETDCTSVVVFRIGFAIWSLCFWSIRIPHVWELYCRPILRQSLGVVHLVGSPVPPVWMATTVLLTLIGLLVGFAFARKPRVFHLLSLPLLCFLYAFEGRNAGGYGALAFIVWILLLIVPYDQWRDASGAVRKVPITGQRLLMLQWASVYAFTIPAKLLDGAGWINGSAVWRAVHSQHVGNFLLTAWWDMPLWVCRYGGYAALTAEAFIAFGIWFPRTRKPAMAVCFVLHLTFALSLNISPLFHTLMVLHLVLFIDSSTWTSLRARFRRTGTPVQAPSS